MIDKTTDDYKIECYKQALQMIIDIGFDYDGYSKVESLKFLIDELVQFAKNGLKLELPQYTTGDGRCVVHYHGEQELPKEEWNTDVVEWFKYNNSMKLFKQAIDDLQN